MARPPSPDPSAEQELPRDGALRSHGGALYCEQVPIAELAQRFGTPLYVYSQAVIERRVAALRTAFGPDARICYAVKANSNLSILRLLDRLGCGFDLVSGGELARLAAAGLDAGSAVFAGVAKQRWEIDAALQAGISFFNVESLQELGLLADAARAAGTRARVAVRFNPDVDAGTHEYIATGRRGDKFGLDRAAAAAAVAEIAATPALELVGYHVHLGSQLSSPEPYLAAWLAVEAFMDEAPAHRDGVRYYDLGGGFGIGGDGTAPLDVAALAERLVPRLVDRGLTPVVEPGRFLIADAGALLTTVLGVKQAGDRRFALVDAAMNDLMRPALYRARHPVAADRAGTATETLEYDVVGPVCETGDFLARACRLPALRRGDLLSVLAAGAYGMAMASNYNSRGRAAEVLVCGTDAKRIRRREELADLWAAEDV